MTIRVIPKRARNRDLAVVLQTLFIAELVKPSRQLWIVSPWIADVPLVDNRAGVLSRFSGRWEAAELRLLDIVRYLAERGTQVRIVTKDLEENASFLRQARQLENIAFPRQGSVRVQIDTMLHTKGILGDEFWLAGSMNLTVAGVQRNDEQITLHLSPPMDPIVSQVSHWAQQYGGSR
jgi:phosphatidylserine/phosphatidylglycerophosphate/cardiolipin synthase-like enzyme